MKRLLLLFCICVALGCKKDAISDLADQQFVLRSATVSPAMMVNGKAETNYMTMPGASVCLNYDYTLTFKKDGTYEISSKGPLCDMIAGAGNLKWTKDGDKVTLSHSYGASIVATLKGDRLVYTQSSLSGGVNYSIEFKFEAK